MKTRYKYIHFERMETTDRDYLWVCLNNRYGDPLGHVEYETHWHTHIFKPAHGTVFSADCLDDISKFMKQLNEGKK